MKGLPDYSQPWNMNIEWLRMVASLIQKYIESNFEEDFESMYKALESLELITSPKIDHDEVEKKLEWLYENKDKVYVTGEDGRPRLQNDTNKKLLEKEFKNCFRLLLVKIDKGGFLIRSYEYTPEKAIISQ